MIIRPSERHTCTAVFPMTTETYSKITLLPGFYKWKDRDIVFRPTPANVEYLLRAFPDAQWLDGTDEHITILKERDRIAAEIRAGKIGEDTEDKFEYRIKPYRHQRKAFLLSRDREAFALLMEQRTGKTKVVIDTAAYLWREKKIHTLIVISVNGVHRNWTDSEIPKHMPTWVNYKCYFQKSNHNKEQQKKFSKVAGSKGLRIFAFHIDMFSGSQKTKLFDEAIGDGSGVLIAIDESTRIKNLSSARAKYLDRVGSRAAYRRILTGTPYVKDPMDFYGQFHFLDPSILGYDTITSFKSHFCKISSFAKGADGKFKLVNPENDKHSGGARFEKITGIKNADELQRLVEGYSYRVLRKDCMDLPPKIYKRYPIELSPEQRALYKEMADEFIAEFSGHTVSAAMAMTRAIRLQQILCNWWPMQEAEMAAKETWKKVIPISKVNPRMEALLNILRSTDSKVIIWSCFRPDLEAIQERLGALCVSYHGGVKEEQKARNYRAFQKDPGIRFFAGNPASAGLGLDLSVADTEVFYMNGYNLEYRLQAEDRPEAGGKTNNTLIWDLEVPGTVDTKVIRNLKGKRQTADMINGDPVSFFMEEREDV